MIILLIIGIITIINPQSFAGQVIIKEVQANSSADHAGISPGELVKEINGMPIKSIGAYGSAIEEVFSRAKNAEFKIVTENGTFNYSGKTLDIRCVNNTIISIYGEAETSGLEEGMKIKEINGLSLSNYSFNEIKEKIEPKTKIKFVTNKQEYLFLASNDLGISVEPVSRVRIKTGLDLQGGARALVKPEKPLNSKEMANLLDVVRYRLNVYGITDVHVKEASDLQGNKYMFVELAGATPTQLEDLIGKQGKFEAKIGNKTAFVGGQKDITFVCRNDASCAYVEQCNKIEKGYACRFHFEIHLSEKAAKKQANITSGLKENVSEGKRYLNETLDLYLDDKLVDKLFIDADLKGQEATRIAITGSGVGNTKPEAYDVAEENMHKLQTVLITGSLPFKLKIVKLDSISPLLGREFTKNIFFIAVAAFLAVCLIIYLRYRKFVLFVPVIITVVSELLLILAVAVLIKWNLDLASIAGIIAAIGTGVDDQVVMIDESRVSKQYSIKERIKRAFSIIMGSYATTVVAMLPLWWAGAGLLRGFAVTTLIGITIGVFITRPAFADILKKITKD